MQFNQDEKDILIEALQLLFDERNLDYLPTDENGKYYPRDPNSPNKDTPWNENYDAMTANIISSLICRFS